MKKDPTISFYNEVPRIYPASVRTYLREMGAMCLRASTSRDLRVVRLALKLLKIDGLERFKDESTVKRSSTRPN